MEIPRIEKHLERYSVSENGCWEWTGPYRNKYGHLRAGPKTYSAHRYFFAMLVRPLEPGEWVLHRCDNHRCVNPLHLYAGGHRENVRDVCVRGAVGPKRPRVGLSEEDVKAIRASKETCVALGARYGISKETARSIKAGESHRHVEWSPETYMGRQNGSGENHHSAKLTIQAVREIKLALGRGEAKKRLADRYGVNPTTIRAISSGRAWASVHA